MSERSAVGRLAAQGRAKEVRDAIEKAGKQSKRPWDYFNENSETLFGSKNQVAK